MNKQFTVSIIGCGSRGGDAYGQLMYREKDFFRIASLCDINRERLMHYGALFQVEENLLFDSEEEFFMKKRSDVLVIATQDRDHVRMCRRALELGYEILLEKPVSPMKEELFDLLATHNKYPHNVVVCHVLRYAPAFRKVKELLEQGVIGRLVMIDALEQVSYWHQAHSFVRGNWRSEKETSPMIMQKCCHDLDLLQYYADSVAETVYSAGSLTFFTHANMPRNAATRCKDCPLIESCPYSAERVYVARWKDAGCPLDAWPYNVVATAPLTEEKLRVAYENGSYGRCVFACDNDVVDHQSVSVVFRNGVQANLTMTAFTYESGRKYTFHGTAGEIRLDEDRDLLCVMPFGQSREDIRISDLVEEMSSFGHGGGDYGLIQAFYKILTGVGLSDTALERSVESHLLALAAEQSRKSGKVVFLHDVKEGEEE